MKNKINRKVLGVILLLGFIFLLVAPVFAADTGIVPCGHDKACTLCDLIKGFKILFDYGIKIIAVITLACATFAGVMYIVSSGNESTMESAKKFLSASLIGFAVVLGAWVMVNTTITVLMPTQEGMGIGKKWSEFGNINCSSSAPPPCSNSCNATSQPNCQASSPANSETGSGTCCDGVCYKCKAGYNWDGSACSLSAPIIITASLSSGKVDVAYMATLSASGGDGTYTWLVTGLPAGLSQTNNIISGTPTVDGTFKVNIKLTSGTQNVSKQLNLIINAKSKCELLAGSKSADFVFMLVRTPFGVPAMGPQKSDCENSKNWDSANQSDLSEFKTLASMMANGLKQVESANQPYFAVYRMDEIYDGTNGNKLLEIIKKDCPEAAKNKLFSYGYMYNGEGTAYVISAAKRNAYYKDAYYCVTGHEYNGINYIDKTFAHEQIGHMFARLNDEYLIKTKECDLRPWVNITKKNNCTKWQAVISPDNCYKECNCSKDACFRSTANSIMREHYKSDGIFSPLQNYIINACVKNFANCPPSNLIETKWW